MEDRKRVMQCRDREVISGKQKQKYYKCEIETETRKIASGTCSAKIEKS
jgi:hypothetical protein